MEPNKKIIYKWKSWKPEEAFLTDKSLMKETFHFSDQQIATAKFLTDTMNFSTLGAPILEVTEFEKEVTADFKSIVRGAFREKWRSNELSKYLISLLDNAFKNWFTARFLRPDPSTWLLPDKDFENLFRAWFKEEFWENFPLFLNVFFDQHNDAVTYVAYENLIADALEDAYTQIDLQHNPEIPGATSHTSQNEADKEGNLNIFLN